MKVRDYAGKITASGRHLLDLINDVLDISKIESGKATMNLAEFDLGDSLEAVVSMIGPLANDKGQTLHTEITGVNHDRLIGDATHLDQILVNLLSNAVKYTPEGGTIHLRFIGLPQHSEQFEHIRIEVEDNGYGMSPEFLETIFDSFTRAENSTTNKVQGTGLGMSITKNLVDLMGGTIEAYSTEGEGSLFRVDLELRIPEEQASNFFWEQLGIRAALLVDTDCGRSEQIESYLEQGGISVSLATDASQAVACAQKSSPGSYQLILFGCDLLDEETIASAEKIRNAIRTNEEHPVPILFVLDHSFDAAEDLTLPPVSGIQVRPFFLSTLKHKIEDIAAFEEDPDFAFHNALRAKHFLAAEDNLMNASILTELLDMEGASVEICENGQLVVERFEAADPGEFDAILMDVQMPVMNGHEAARAIRRLDREDAHSIPIIAMTADAFVEDEKAALAAGMNAHVAKPLDMEELKRVVEEFVEKGRS